MQNPVGAVTSGLTFSSPEEAFQRASAWGLSHLEWFADDGGFPRTGDEVDLARRLAAEHGVENAYHAPFMGKWDLGLAGEHAAGFLRLHVETADRLGARVVTVHLGSHAKEESPAAALDRTIGALAEVAPAAESAGIVIGVENFVKCYNEKDMGCTVGEFERLFAAVDSPSVGLNLDVGHANVTGTLGPMLEGLSSRMVNMHLHGNGGDADDHIPFGQGTVDWPGLLDSLVGLGYGGPMTLEWHDAKGPYADAIAVIRAA